MAVITPPPPQEQSMSSARRRASRLLGRATAATLALVVVGGLVAHSGPVRAAVLQRAIVEIAARTGVVLTAESLHYNLLGLRARLSGVTLAAAADPQSPFFAAEVVEIAVSRSALSGSLSLESVRLDDARVAIVRRADGTTNLPSGGDDSGGDPGAIAVDRLDVSRLAVSVVDERRALARSLSRRWPSTCAATAARFDSSSQARSARPV